VRRHEKKRDKQNTSKNRSHYFSPLFWFGCAAIVLYFRFEKKRKRRTDESGREKSAGKTRNLAGIFQRTSSRGFSRISSDPAGSSRGISGKEEAHPGRRHERRWPISLLHRLSRMF
jgi:hypothetical protein